MNTTKPTYVIVKTRHFYGPEDDKRSLVQEDTASQYTAIFSTPKAARAFITELKEDRYYLSHNEYSAPDYKVARIDRLPEYLRWQL